MPMDKPVVLVVDDAAGIREMVSQILNDEGYAIEAAADGVEALAVVERVRPNLVLLDMRMPNMNGWEFARILNERRDSWRSHSGSSRSSTRSTSSAHSPWTTLPAAVKLAGLGPRSVR